MGEMASETGPPVDLHQQFGNLDARQHQGGLVDRMGSGNRRLCLSATNFSAGSSYSSKSLNCREPWTQMSPERRRLRSSDSVHNS